MLRFLSSLLEILHEVAVKRISVKVHSSGGYTVVAMCDEDLLGSEVNHGRVKIRFTEEFFGGILVDSNSPELESLLARADSITAFGKTCIEYLAKIFPTVPEAVLEVGGIPYVQIFRMPFE